MAGWTMVAGLVLGVAAAAPAAVINTYVGGTTEPVFSFYNGTPTPSITPTASSSWAGLYPVSVVDGGGFWTNEPPGSTVVGTPDFKIPLQHSNSGANSKWFSDGGTVNLQWISFDLGGTYLLDTMEVWNYFQPGFSDRGIQTAYLWTSTAASPTIAATSGGASPGADWTMLGSGPFTFAISPSSGLTNSNTTTVNFGGAAARHVLVDIETRFSDAETIVGLDEVQFSGEAAPMIPEPATLGLLGVGGLAAVVRRRRAG